MAHESFEDDAVALYVNENFVAVKVDREERPDVDAVYMEAVQAATGQGGWPMTVFCTPEGRPFYFGTYFPPAPRHGMPSFRQVLEGVAAAWRGRRGEVAEVAERVVRSLQGRGPAYGEPRPPSEEELHAALLGLSRDFDTRSAGFGGAPKFPPSMVLEFLLRHHARTGSEAALEMAESTCTAMARGGIYDQLGGGFARYCVDSTWTVPHFEKMLYDNALLLRVYTHLWRALPREAPGSALARRVALETAGFLLRELRTAEGGFASALDADSEGPDGKPEEGAYYVWTPGQLADALGPRDGARAAELFGVSEDGTFERGLSVLRLPEADEPDPAIRSALFEARARRPKPARDDKVVAAWNGLAIAALAEAGALFDRPDLVAAAEAAADLLVAVHLDGAGARLVRTSRDGRAGGSAGVLEDYADTAEGFLALYSVTGDTEWFTFAGLLLDTVLERFTAPDGTLYDTADDAERLIRRPQDPTDNAAPSGWTAAAGALLGYAALTGSDRHRRAAERALGVVRALGGRVPRFIGWGLAVAEALLDGPREIAVVGPPDAPATRALHRAALLGTAPGAVVALGEPGATDTAPVLRDRPLVGGTPAAYVCRNFTCDAPTTDPRELAERLTARWPPGGPRG